MSRRDWVESVAWLAMGVIMLGGCMAHAEVHRASYAKQSSSGAPLVVAGRSVIVSLGPDRAWPPVNVEGK